MLRDYRAMMDYSKYVLKTLILPSNREKRWRWWGILFVFNGGRIVQTGSHERLLGDKEGIYSRMWEAQAKYYI